MEIYRLESGQLLPVRIPIGLRAHHEIDGSAAKIWKAHSIVTTFDNQSWNINEIAP